MLMQTTLKGFPDKVEQAIQRIKTFDPISAGLMDTPYYVAYSGGKDSDAIRILCELAGVKYDLVHSHTTADAPETVYYVRSIPNIQFNYPDMSMWELLEKKGLPPTRKMRYCCEVLKEGYGTDRFVVTGVRWAESVRRKVQRGGVEVLGSSHKNKLILNADNDESRRLIENCTIKGKRILNPIIDWSDGEVWEFLDYYGCKSNPLYQEGFLRVGFVGCPMASKRNRERDFLRWPKYKQNYIRAFQRMVDAHGYAKTSRNFTSGEAVFNWWIRNTPSSKKPLEHQTDIWKNSFFEDAASS